MLKKTSLFALLAVTALTGCITKVDNIKAPDIAAEPKVKVASVPEMKAEELVSLDVLTSNHYVSADNAGDIVVRLRLKAQPRKDARRPPINLALVVDASGSMDGAAIDDARKASLALLDNLAEGDRLSLIVFNSGTEVLVPSTQLTKKTISEIREKIKGIKATGTTDLAGGLDAGIKEIQKGFRNEGINRVVLLGDGIPNDAAPLQQLANVAAGKHISITALGLGLEYDETLMSQIALSSGGKYHFVRESSAVAKVFKDEVLRLKEVTGKATQIALMPGPGVTVKEVIGLPMTQAGKGYRVVLGDLSEGDERDVFVRLSVPARHDGSLVELLDADISLDNPLSPGNRLSQRAFVSVRATTDKEALEKGREREVEHRIARFDVADAIVKAVAAARNGRVDVGQSILDKAEKDASLAGKTFEDAELLEKAKSIGPLRKSLASMAPATPVATTRDDKPVAGKELRRNAPKVAPSVPKPSTAPSPQSAAIIMSSQADAVRTIQGR